VTRILYWNIENFARNKINDPVTNKRQKGSTVMRDVASAQRRWYIQQVLVAANPEIIVVVEVETGYDGNGRLARGTGLTGALNLLTYIRGWAHAGWMLVPPIQTGPREAVAVYYDSTLRFFTGPYTWPGGALATAAAPGGGTGDYPAAPDNVIGGLPDPLAGAPPRGNIPAGAQYNVGVAERRCAARTAFTHSAANMVNAGAPIAWGAKARSPYMATFAEMNPAGTAVARNLSIFGIHAPARQVPAAAHMALIDDTAEIVDNLGVNEVRVVAGDFNLNLMLAGAAYALNPAYAGLTAQGYTRALDPLPAPPAPPLSYKEYFATHIRTRRKATCWGPVADPALYPGYKYTGSDQVQNFYAIDNIFVHPNGGPAPANFTILNPVVGSPFTTNPAPFPVPGPGGSGTRLQGTIALARISEIPPLPGVMGGPAPPAGPVSQAGLPSAFRGWANYGGIRSTSDHFALAIDV
jgi:hypothetical protein